MSFPANAILYPAASTNYMLTPVVDGEIVRDYFIRWHSLDDNNSLFSGFSGEHVGLWRRVNATGGGEQICLVRSITGSAADGYKISGMRSSYSSLAEAAAALVEQGVKEGGRPETCTTIAKDIREIHKLSSDGIASGEFFIRQRCLHMLAGNLPGILKVYRPIGGLFVFPREDDENNSQIPHTSRWHFRKKLVYATEGRADIEITKSRGYGLKAKIHGPSNKVLYAQDLETLHRKVLRALPAYLKHLSGHEKLRLRTFVREQCVNMPDLRIPFSY